ncbi:helix-turn-helix domain-containing protein [bacterium]|nr:helix-turn-helix domain-containing protein [bacterium]
MTPVIADYAAATRFGIFYQDFDDIDLQSKCLTGYDQKYQQLSCGKFQGQFTTISLGAEFGIYFEVLNQMLDQSGAVPKDHYLVIFLMNRKGHCKINGQTFLAHHIFYAGPGTSITGVSGPGTYSAVVNIGKEFFEAILKGCYPSFRQGFLIPRFGILESNQTGAQALRQFFFQAQTILNTNSGKAINSLSIRNFRQTMAEQIADQLFNSIHLSTEDKSISISSRFQIVKSACEFIQDNQDEEISITRLCQQTGVSRRTLEYSFKDCIGQSPSAYLRSIKLNGIRRALLAPENQGKSIGDIAAEWGVWHLSRFAQYYRNQFHELPSETRKIMDT